MIFFAMIVFALVLLVAPWWMTALVAFLMGLWWSGTWRQSLQVSLGAGLVTGALAFVADGRSHGLISQRIGALFQLPSANLLFLFAAILVFVQVFLAHRAGASWRCRSAKLTR